MISLVPTQIADPPQLEVRVTIDEILADLLYPDAPEPADDPR